MQLTYNGYPFADNMTSYSRSIRIERSQTNLPAIAHERWIIRGRVRGSGASDISSQCATLQAAMIDGGNLSFVDTNDSITSSLQLNGCQVDEIKWLPNNGGDPLETGATYVNMRLYEIVINAQRMAGTSGDIMMWQESVTLIGDGGPKWIMVPSLNGPCLPMQVMNYTPYIAIQQGRSVGLNDYAAFPDPIWPLWEHQEMRVQSRETPKRWGNTNANNLEYPAAWKYTFECASALSGIPNLFH